MPRSQTIPERGWRARRGLRHAAAAARCAGRLGARAMMIVLLLAGGVAWGGCNVLGVATGRLLPEPKRPPMHALDRVPTAVVVEADPQGLGEWSVADLDPVTIAARQSLRQIRRLSVVDEPDAADQLVVIDMRAASAETYLASDIRRERVAARVRVIHADGREVWPADGTPGFPISAQTPAAATDRQLDLRRAALRSLGEQAAALFRPTEVE